MKNIENTDRQKNISQETSLLNIQDRIFELEKQLDQMRAFIQISEPNVNESQDLKNKVEHFRKEVKRLTFELLQLRLKQRDEEVSK